MNAHAPAVAAGGAGIRAVGIDIIEVCDIEAALERFGERYLARVYTPGERDAWRGGREGRDARHLAPCFAAKEATLKAIGDEAGAADWRWIDVHRESSTAVRITLAGALDDVARARGIVSLVGSVGADRRHAIAVVFALGPAA